MTIIDTIRNKLILALCLLTLAISASAQTVRYVSDEFQAPVREEPLKDSRVVTLLVSGTRVEVLQEGVRGYSLVRAQGTEGWVRERDLMDIPSGRARLSEAEKRFEERRVALEAREREIKDLQARVADLAQRNETLQDNSQVLADDLDALRKRTAKPLATEAKNRRLEHAVIKERQTVRTLMDENDALKVQAIRTWFLVGAGVALGSLLIGFVIARISRRRQQKW